MAEVEPVAMITFFAPMTVPSLIVMVLRSLKVAMPVNNFTPLAVSSCLIPLLSWVTTLFLCPIITA